MPSTATSILDGISTSTAIKAPVKVVTNANLTLSGEQTVNSVACVSGDRVLAKNQTTTSENGIWVVSTGSWTRAKDFDGNRDVRKGTLVTVEGSTVLYRVTSSNPIVIDTSAITFEALGPSQTQADIAVLLNPITAAEIAEGVTPTDYAFTDRDDRRYGFPYVNTWDYLNDDGSYNAMGFVPQTVKAGIRAGTSTVDVHAYLQDAIDAAGDENRDTVKLRNGRWNIGAGLAVNHDGVRLVGSSRRGTVLRATAGSISLVRLTQSYGGIEAIKFDGNSQSAVTAIRLADADEAQVTTVTQKNFNTLRDIWIDGVAEGMVLKPGPDVASADSGCWYNSFENIHIQGSTRGIWLREGTNAGASGPNRNFFRGIRIGQSGSNTGIQIDSSDTNMFSQCSFEGIAIGTSPNATPVAIKIADTDANGASVLYNTFMQCFWEACTHDLINASASSQFYGCFPAAAKTTWTTVPHVFLGGYLAGPGPLQCMHGYVFQSNAESAGVPDDITYFPGGAGVPPASGMRYGAGGPLDLAGSGSPESAVTAPVGSTYRRSDGGAGTSLYIKQSGAGNTGWSAITP